MKKLIDTIEQTKEKKLMQIRKAFELVESSAEVILYGSRARGDASAESDYDLFILIDGHATLEGEDTFRRELFPIELETGADLTIFLVNKKDRECLCTSV